MRSVTEQMDAIFRDFPNEINNIVDEESERAAKETADRLKSTSPRNKGKYARGWKVARDPDSLHGHVVYNTEYQLTHLLEHGHLAKNQYGTYGRVPGIEHIKPAEEAGKMQYELKVRVRISRGLK